jgi:hydrogenase maturation protease
VPETKNQTLVLGIGNLLMKDEGVGIHVIRELEKEPPESADLIDGGTGGYQLLGLFTGYRRVILVDATLDENPAGTVRVTHPCYSKDFPIQLSAHEIGLRDMIEALELTGSMPQFDLVTISVKDYADLSLDLSDDVKAAVPLAVETIRALLSDGRSKH